MYIDPKEYKIYQLEYQTNSINYLSKYKTNQEGKMYLSYHRRVFGWKNLKEFNPKAPAKPKGVIFKHEFITLKIKEKDYKKFSSTLGDRYSRFNNCKYPIQRKTLEFIISTA